MKIVEGILYIEFSDIVESGVSETYLSKALSNGYNIFNSRIKDPNDARKWLFVYEDLAEKYREMIIARFGDPYHYISLTPILNAVEQDASANGFYLKYRTQTGAMLPYRTTNKYTRAASWLNLFMRVQDEKDFLKSITHVKTLDFYKHAGELIAVEKKSGKDKSYTGMHELPGNFPSTYQRILNKVRTYREQGYESLIDEMYGNKLAAKIGKTECGFDAERWEEQIAVIRHIASKHNNFDAVQIERFANVVFEQKGWAKISARSIRGILREYKLELTPGRRGRREFNNTMAMQNKRVPPKYPTHYWTLDGWTVELLYQDKDRYDNRLVVVVVLDAVNKYPIGYAIGHRENAELIKEAVCNGVLHLKELTGNTYHPYQLQSDRYQLKHLTPFYQAMAHLHTPAAVGNAKSKTIEPYFKQLNKDYCQLMPNWSGFNIDAKRANQVNREMLDKIKTTFPDRAGVIKQIEAIMTYERRAKAAEYLRLWSEMPVTDRMPMNRGEWLYFFGRPIGRTNRISGQGIVKTIEGKEYTYDSFEPEFRGHQHTDWQIFADMQDLSTVLAVSPDGRIRFVLEQKMELPMDIKSTTQEHIDYRKRVYEYNRSLEQRITEMYKDDADTTLRIVKDIPLRLDDANEAALKLMLTYTGQQKERIQDAKKLKTEQRKALRQEEQGERKRMDEWAAQQDEYMNTQVDFDQYKNI